jgi:hypothetical protein
MNIMIRRGIVPENELIQALWVFAKDEDQACHLPGILPRRAAMYADKGGVYSGLARVECLDLSVLFPHFLFTYVYVL